MQPWNETMQRFKIKYTLKRLFFEKRCTCNSGNTSAECWSCGLSQYCTTPDEAEQIHPASRKNKFARDQKGRVVSDEEKWIMGSESIGVFWNCDGRHSYKMLGDDET